MSDYEEMRESLTRQPENVRVLHHAFPFNEEECQVMSFLLERGGYHELCGKMRDYIRRENLRHMQRERALEDQGFRRKL